MQMYSCRCIKCRRCSVWPFVACMPPRTFQRPCAHELQYCHSSGCVFLYEKKKWPFSVYTAQYVMTSASCTPFPSEWKCFCHCHNLLFMTFRHKSSLHWPCWCLYIAILLQHDSSMSCTVLNLCKTKNHIVVMQFMRFCLFTCKI